MSSVSKMYRRRSSGRLATRKKRSVMSVTLRPALRTLAIVGVFFVCTGPTFITSLICWVSLALVSRKQYYLYNCTTGQRYIIRYIESESLLSMFEEIKGVQFYIKNYKMSSSINNLTSKKTIWKE